MNIALNFTDKEAFYRQVLRCLNAFVEEDCLLTPTEETLLVLVLCTPGPIEGRVRRTILQKSKMSTQSLSAHIKRIKNKGWLDKYGIPDKAIKRFQEDQEAKFSIILSYEDNRNTSAGV